MHDERSNKNRNAVHYVISGSMIKANLDVLRVIALDLFLVRCALHSTDDKPDGITDYLSSDFVIMNGVYHVS